MKDLLKLSAYDYPLPEELIAQTPIKQRDTSRLLKINKTSGEIEDGVFTDVLDLLNEGDCLVLNETRVIPARLYGNSVEHVGQVEVVLLSRHEGDVWRCMTRPGKKTRVGESVDFGEMRGTVVDVLDDGVRLVEFKYDGVFNEVLDRIGLMPLPPYIKERLEDKERYQTVYSRTDGSAAAPTAGLHFTEELIKKLEDKGVIIAKVLLHVGIGTFRPVKCENITEHHMHREYIKVTPETAKTINDARNNGGRIVCVGTTSCRTIESVADENGIIHEYEGETGIFIYPSYRFKAMDALITNFHLPESSLLMLVSAFGGYDTVMRAYKHAVESRYRFFSFGDAMLIV